MCKLLNRPCILSEEYLLDYISFREHYSIPKVKLGTINTEIDGIISNALNQGIKFNNSKKANPLLTRAKIGYLRLHPENNDSLRKAFEWKQFKQVIDYCGPLPYVNCSICKQQPCSYHYTPQGYQWISQPINTNISALLHWN